MPMLGVLTWSKSRYCVLRSTSLGCGGAQLLLPISNVGLSTQINEGKGQCEYPIIMKNVIPIMGN